MNGVTFLSMTFLEQWEMYGTFRQCFQCKRQRIKGKNWLEVYNTKIGPKCNKVPPIWKSATFYVSSFWLPKQAKISSLSQICIRDKKWSTWGWVCWLDWSPCRTFFMQSHDECGILPVRVNRQGRIIIGECFWDDCTIWGEYDWSMQHSFEYFSGSGPNFRSKFDTFEFFPDSKFNIMVRQADKLTASLSTWHSWASLIILNENVNHILSYYTRC